MVEKSSQGLRTLGIAHLGGARWCSWLFVLVTLDMSVLICPAERDEDSFVGSAEWRLLGNGEHTLFGACACL